MSASAIKLMGAGIASLPATLIGNTVSTIAGVGTIQATTAALVYNVNLLTTSGGATAFVLSTQWAIGDTVTVFNTSATAALVYPPVGGAIDGGSTDASVSIAQNEGREFIKVTSTSWRSGEAVLSASSLSISGNGTIGGTLGVTGAVTMAGGFSNTQTSALTALGSLWNSLEKMTLSATGIVSGNGRGGRREMNLSGTVTGGAFIMGGQDKLIVTGTMNHADSRLAAGYSQLDGSAGTFTAGQLSGHWIDMGATAPGGGWNTGGQANTLRLSNTTASNVNSHVYAYGKADYFGDFSNNSSAWIDATAHGSTAAGRIKILVNGVAAYLHVFSD